MDFITLILSVLTFLASILIIVVSFINLKDARNKSVDEFLENREKRKNEKN
jgi:hypothetical protein